MKKLLTLMLCCLLLSGCGKEAETPPAESEPAVFDYSALPANLTGDPIPSPDGSTLFYCTTSQLRAWDLSSGLHRVVKEMEGQVLTAVLLDGQVLQCTAEGETFFLSAENGTLLHRGRGEYRVETDGSRYSAILPNDLTVWGILEGEPMLLTAQRASVPYFQHDLTSLEREARKLEEEYGITILLGEDAAVHPSITPEPLEPVLRQALTSLRQALAPYPPEVLRQTAAHFTRLSLCPVRSIGDGGEGLFLQDGEAFLAIAPGSDLESALRHGLFHLMETHILSTSTGFDRWEELNPAGFQYDYDFAANAGRDSGVYLFGAQRAFADTYSMSYPREDRARIMESAMEAGNECLFLTPIMQSKLKTLCTAIREAFSLEEEEPFLWEQYLE